MRYSGSAGADPPPLDSTDPAQQVRDDTLGARLSRTAIALAAVALFATLLGRWVAGRELRPLRAIVRRMPAENMSDRLPVQPTKDELAILAETFNDMLDRIPHGIAQRGRALDSQRLFTANAAHELRTPLATMLAAIDVTLDGEPGREEILGMTADIRAAADRNRRTLDGLLALAHCRAGADEACEVDLSAVAADTLAGAAAELSESGLTLRAELRPAPMSGDPVLLERMALNLIVNAVRHNRPAGRIRMSTGHTEHRAFRRRFTRLTSSPDRSGTTPPTPECRLRPACGLRMK